MTVPDQRFVVQKAPQAALHICLGWLVDQVVDLATHQFRIRQPGQLGDALVDRPQVPSSDTAQAGSSKESINSLKLRCERMMTWLELVELLFRRRCPHMLLQPVQQPFQFADFAPSPVGVDREQDRQNQDPNGIARS